MQLSRKCLKKVSRRSVDAAVAWSRDRPFAISINESGMAWHLKTQPIEAGGGGDIEGTKIRIPKDEVGGVFRHVDNA